MTHTGQPGPEMSRSPPGNRDFKPKRAAAMVWVPQTSMMVRGAMIKCREAPDDFLDQVFVPEFINKLHRPGSATG